MRLVTWLLALVGPVAIRALSALGFTAVIFTGVEVSVNQLLQSAQTSWGTLPYAVLQMSAISGVPEALGMIFGALLGVFSLKAAVGLSSYVFKPK